MCYPSLSGLWVFLVFGTYLLDDNVEGGVKTLTLFPLARGFRIKPNVFLFAPVWFLCCMIFALAAFLKVQEAAGSGASPIRLLAIKVIGLAMVLSGLMCLFETIPKWILAKYVTIALVCCLPLWFFVGQGFTPRSAIYVSCYIIFTVLSAVPDVAPYMNVICSVILLILLMAYPFVFKQPNVRLYLHFEVISQRRVVDHRLVEKEYEMVPPEGAGAYAERADDYAEADAVNKKSKQEAEAKQAEKVVGESTA